MKKLTLDEVFSFEGSKYCFTQKDGKTVLKNLGNVVGYKKYPPPSQQEVRDYFSKMGYTLVAADKMFMYYHDADNPEREWKDGKDNIVKDWKKKARSVWFRDEYKIKEKNKGHFAFGD
jgi:hypothetical protein